jgi:hypothetical protein
MPSSARKSSRRRPAALIDSSASAYIPAAALRGHSCTRSTPLPDTPPTVRLRFAAFAAAWVFCVSAALADPAHPDPAAALGARYVALKQQLEESTIQRGLYVESNESATTPRGDAYAVIRHPFATVAGAFSKPSNWCESMILHLNVQYCRLDSGDGQPQLIAAVGKNTPQSLDDTHRITFNYRITSSTANYLGVELVADEGPLGTRDYRIALEVTSLPDQRAFMHIQYSYKQGAMARYASNVYFSTKGRDKVGFTLVHEEGDEPRLVRGTRGALERNTMRYYLAFDAYLRSLSSPAPQRFEQSLEIWFADTERFARQLREVKHDDYIAMKREQYLRQQTPM